MAEGLIIIPKTETKRLVVGRTTWTPPGKDKELHFVKIAEQTKDQDGNWFYLKGRVLTIPEDPNPLQLLLNALTEIIQQVEGEANELPDTSQAEEDDIPF